MDRLYLDTDVLLDVLIAAHALPLGLTVVTANEAELSRVPDLTVENWLR